MTSYESQISVFVKGHYHHLSLLPYNSCGRPFHSRPFHFVPTAPHATTTNPAAHAPSTITTSTQQPLPLPLPLQSPATSFSARHPPRTSAPLDYSHPIAPAAAAASPPNFRRGVVPQSPFRNKAANSLQRPLRRLSAARLWNPTNSSRGLVSSSSSSRTFAATALPSTTHSPSATRGRAPSSPPPPNVPLSHPALHETKPVDNDDPIGTGAGDYPLLSLPEQRQIRHSTSPRASLQVERAGSEKRISLPRSVRHSYDSKRLSACVPAETEHPEQTVQTEQTGADAQTQITFDPTEHPHLFGLSFDVTEPNTKLDKGKGKATTESTSTPAYNASMPAPEDDRTPNAAEAGRGYSKDLERGPDILGDDGNNHMMNRNSTVSMPDGIGSAISSSNSSIMGDPEVQPGDMMGGEEWGPQHPCFPHRNPHVSVDDPEYITTRIIRVRRDWLIMGDLAPTFSNLYPEILDPAGMSEQEFRRVVEKMNRELTETFAPWSVRNVLDGVLGLVTGWLWEDLGMTAAKGRLAKLEKWIEQWNEEMARTAEEGGPVPPKIIPLRQTGYMTLDIQIGDPEIAPAPPSTPARSHHAIEVAATS
ncbi:ras modification protein erf4 [Ophiostoma piceae UAMH 11346]|uniref:Ras modification protein ERF4 n=1 Tax=Ophiostoma piceae (strain UAMH 11346) TaxID=1262450 RepID=S3C763_OPHP1|nr:ras modification protein erf4 [Ophiostoma piceae UAMH 11346]